MSEENRQLLHRWFEEVWNKGRTDAIDEMFAAHGVAHGLPDESGTPLKGPPGFKLLHAKFREAFPDITVTVDDTFVEGDKLSARCNVRCKHKGESLGVAATTSPVEFTGMTIVRIKDGKIVEAWNNFDFMKMYQQVGVL